MTRERVAGYRKLCRSLELLDRRIQQSGWEGRSEEADRERAELCAQRDKLAAEVREIRGFVDRLREEDEVVWQIIEMYYMARERPTLQAVAMRMGWQSEFAPRYRLKRFFREEERR